MGNTGVLEPSGIVIPSIYTGGATLVEVRVTHPLAVVEAVEDSSVGVNSHEGIHCALQSRLAAAVELRRSASGKDWCRISVVVGEVDEVTWVSVSVFEEKARALAGIARGTELYVEGRLTMNIWEGKDGQQRTGLSVTAWEVLPLGQIGRRKPKVQSGAPGHAEEFDDALTF